MQEIRKCNVQDFNLLLDFLKKVDSSFPIPLSQKQDISMFLNKACKYGEIYAFFENGIIVAAVFFYANDIISKTSYISVLAVLSEYYGNGFATALVKKAILVSKQQEMKKIRLYTHKTNISAISLYQKIGFKPHSDDNRPDDILFVLNLGDF